MGTFTQKTDYLIETKGLLKDRINSLGGSITNQTTFRDYLVWLDSLYEALDEKTITGLPDSLEGNITQTTTQTGKNLLPNNATTQEINGITYTINEDKSIKVNGIANGRADLYLYGSSSDNGEYLYIPKGNYTLNIQNITNGTMFYAFREKTAGTRYQTNTNNGVIELLAQQDCYFYGVMLAVESGRTITNMLIYPQLEKGSSPSSYEPFIPNSPTPSSPQPINVVSGRQVVSVCGKNLLSYMYAKGYSTTINGITWTINQDGSITANGTATSLSIFQFANADNLKSIIGKTIKLNGTPSNAPQDCFMGIYTASWSVIGNSYAGQDTNAITINDTATRVIARIPSGTTINNLTFYPMIRLSSITDTTYEEYKGTDYEINLGKNLFDDSTLNNQWISQNGTITTVAGSNSIKLNCKAGETYSLSTTYEDTSTGYEITAMAFYNSSGTLLNRQVRGSTTYQTITATAPTNTAYMYVGHYITKPLKIQLEKGQPTLYSPYKTPIYLGKIGNYQDYIFKNTPLSPLYDSNLEEGQWYIHKEIGRVVLNGSENWNAYETTYKRLNLLLSDASTISARTMCYSNYFKFSSSSNDAGTCFTYGGRIYLYPTLDINTTALFKTWLSTHNTEVYYVLATPTNTLIEDEELINQLNEIEIFTVISEDFYN